MPSQSAGVLLIFVSYDRKETILIAGKYVDGYFELYVTNDGVIEFLILNGIVITKDETDLGKLAEAYFAKRNKDRQARLEEVFS